MTYKININGIDHTVDVDGDTPSCGYCVTSSG